MPSSARVLVVANRTAATAALRAAVADRAARGPASFHLVVPASPHGMHRVVDPDVAGREEAAARLEEALPLLEEAGGSEVTGEVGTADPLAAIMDAVHHRGFDEIILSTLPRRISRWLRVDLPSKARGLGLPVTHVEVPDAGIPTEDSLAAV
ncbi:MAG TPA: hypothetical protein VGV57_12340 [Thermoleophilaceae bacterium]|nr:hypothetical protein [Thermoleophilaceae bacterium]